MGLPEKIEKNSKLAVMWHWGSRMLARQRRTLASR